MNVYLEHANGEREHVRLRAHLAEPMAEGYAIRRPHTLVIIEKHLDGAPEIPALYIVGNVGEGRAQWELLAFKRKHDIVVNRETQYLLPCVTSGAWNVNLNSIKGHAALEAEAEFYALHRREV